MSVEIIECQQGTPEWLAARLGVPTASRFSDVMAKGEGKSRGKYLHELAADIVRGWPEPESYSNAHMERGKEMEGQARALYTMTYARGPVTQVGFVRNGRAGASPDSLVGSGGGLEIKTALGHIQIERLKRGSCPPEHIAQVQGNLWVSEREWWDFMSFSPDLPPMVCRVYRDEAKIAEIDRAVEAFNAELDSLVASIRTYGNLRGAMAA